MTAPKLANRIAGIFTALSEMPTDHFSEEDSWVSSIRLRTHGVVESQQTSVVQIGRRFLIPRKRLYGSSA
jgi:hypothetical protein